MQRLIRINAGGRRFETLSTTLTKYSASVLAGITQNHMNKLDADAMATANAAASAANAKAKKAGGKKKPAAPLAKRTSAEAMQAAQLAEALEACTINDLCVTNEGAKELFMDLNPQVFEIVLDFLRTGRITLPTDNDALRAAVVWQLEQWGLTDDAFPPMPVEPTADGEAREVALPDVLVVQLFDHMQHEQGVKRHAMTITFGSDGFRLKNMCKTIRGDLNTQLSQSYWQIYQTNERSAFFVCTRISNGSADLLMTSVSQRVISHAESMGYAIQSSYITLSPDVQHTSVRMFVHNFIFRRVRQPVLEPGDELMELGGDGGGDGEMQPMEGDEEGEMMGYDGEQRGGGRRARDGREEMSAVRGDDDDDVLYKNFEPPRVGPQMGAATAATTPPSQRVDRIWEE